MKNSREQELDAAWQRIDDRLAALQRRHREKGDVPLYDASLKPPATDAEIKQLEKLLGFEIPFELAYSLNRWNGRWIAHDHVIDLSSVSDLLYLARSSASAETSDDDVHGQVIGPVSSKVDYKQRINFGGHEGSSSSLYFDYVEPPAGGRLGQIIRIGEDTAEYVAASFVEFLNLVADAPVRDDDSDFDPLKSRP